MRIAEWFQNRKNVHSNSFLAGFKYRKTWLLMVDKDNPDNIKKRIEIPATSKLSVVGNNKVVTYDAESYDVLSGGVVRQPNTLTMTIGLLKSQISDIEDFARPGVLFYVYHSIPIGGTISSFLEKELKGKKYQITGISYNSVGYANTIEVDIQAVEINIFSTPRMENFVKKKEGNSGSGGTSTPLPKKKEEVGTKKETGKGDWSEPAIRVIAKE